MAVPSSTVVFADKRTGIEAEGELGKDGSVALSTDWSAAWMMDSFTIDAFGDVTTAPAPAPVAPETAMGDVMRELAGVGSRKTVGTPIGDKISSLPPTPFEPFSLRT